MSNLSIHKFEGIQHVSSALNSISRSIQDSVLDEHVQHNAGFITTGFSNLDEAMQGLRNGEVVVIASRPSVGKTTFALNIAEHVAIKNEVPVLIFSSELSSLTISTRLACQMAGVDMSKIRKRKLSYVEAQNLLEVISVIAESPIYIDETPYLGTEEVIDRIRDFQLGTERAGLVIVDDMDFLDYSLSEDKNQRANVLMSSVENFKQLALDINIPLVLTSSLSSDISYQDKCPIPSDVPEVALFQVADLFLMIDRKSAYGLEGDQTAEFIIAKNRRGAVGSMEVKADLRAFRFLDYV